ncbi:protein disulfide isomerase EPS1 Ecym_4493 [Eremothecium cymbalariae DBVPG|uniref:Thioredoxin domain-containing protein n=1 Tax=Eremothecium cymbalariae (strain CBS 270.75 / DBVPG 7215 / KCTC 17166 / NRRL Y-17582) TaxID=931890 RepID=G8JU29_ERECY|nr:hypothetical protein Ecym_4493 [Eremothecium cymbalariae DBVPG\
MKCSLVLWLVSLLASFAYAEDTVITPDTPEDQEVSQIPPPLTVRNFEDTMSKNLHLVEFFSPTCPQCLLLAPKWEDTWKSFHAEGMKLGISMERVNCLESGDLCNQENIKAYPSIKLYGPGGFIQDYPRSSLRNQENFIKFMKDEAIRKENLLSVSETSRSLMLNSEQLSSYIEGRGEKPVLISFWPSENLKNMSKRLSFANCAKCTNYQANWKTLSNLRAVKDIDIAHYNCMKDSTPCKKLKLDHLVDSRRHSGGVFPAVALMLPGHGEDNIIMYKGSSFDPSDLAEFASRTYSNSQFPSITELELNEMIRKPIEVGKPNDIFDSGKTFLVLYQDYKSSGGENLKVLSSLCKLLSGLPGVYLYKSAANLPRLVQQNYYEMIKQINYNSSEPEKLANKQYLDLMTLSKHQSFFMFKQGSLVPNVFYGNYEDVKTLNNWIEQNSLPMVNELKLDNFKQLIEFHGDVYDELAIQLVDTGNSASKAASKSYLISFLVSYHDFEKIRQDNNYKSFEEQSGVPQSSKDEEYFDEDSIQQLILRDRHKVLLAYVDIHDNRILLNKLGLNINKRYYKNGDVLIVNKLNKKFYYDTDPFGQPLTTDSPTYMKATLKALIFPESKPKQVVRQLLINSPFGHHLRFLDKVHQFGLLGWLCTLCVVFTALKSPSLYRKHKTRRRYFAKRDSAGLLGKRRRLKD